MAYDEKKFIDYHFNDGNFYLNKLKYYEQKLF